MNNSTGNVYKVNISGSSYSISDTGDDGATTSNNDGAACHAGDPTVTFNPSVTASQGSCDGSNREIDVTLNNSSSNVATNFVVTYTVNGGSAQTLTSGTSVSSSSNNTSLSVPGQANGAAVVISWYAENTANDLREPTSGTTSLSSITIDASGCSVSPTAVTITASTSLGSCSGGSATSPFNFANSSGSTAYVTVEYSTDGGSSWSVHPQAQANTSNDLVIGSGTSPGQLSSISVPHGSAITWRYKSTDTEGDWTGISYVTLSATSTVNCPTNTFTLAQSLGTCSSGSAIPQLVVTNTGNSTGYFDIEYKLTLNGSDVTNWNTLYDGNSINSGQSRTYTMTAKEHGYQISWRVRSGSSNPSSGSYTSAGTGLTVDCPVIDVSASQALGSCSAGAKTSTLTLNNSSSATVTAYVLVEYSVDGGSNWTQKAANQSVGVNSTETLTQSVSDGAAIIWRYKTSTTSGSFSGSYTTLSASSTVDCPYIDPSVSQSLGSCSGCLLYTSPSPRDRTRSRMPSSA